MCSFADNLKIAACCFSNVISTCFFFLLMYLKMTMTKTRQCWNFSLDEVVQAGVSIKFEVGSWLEKSNRLYEQEAIRPLNLGGSGACSPRKFRNLEALKCYFQHSGNQIITQARLEIIVFAWSSDVK